MLPNNSFLISSNCNEKIKQSVHIIVYGDEENDEVKTHSSNPNSISKTRQLECELDIDVEVPYNCSIYDFKKILRVENLIPDECESYAVEIKVQNKLMNNTDLLPKSSCSIHVTVKPPFYEHKIQQERLQETSRKFKSQRAPLFSNSNLLLNQPNSSLFNGLDLGLPSAQHLNTLEPNIFRQLMNAPVISSLLSNTNFLKSVIDSCPNIRRLRERYPELNYMLNDSHVLEETMQAIRNPSLMREMISNSDRVLNSVNALPGGFDAIKRAYHTLKDPLWDFSLEGNASTGSNSKSIDLNKKSYDLGNHSSPSTTAIPNPWIASTPSSNLSNNPFSFARNSIPNISSYNASEPIKMQTSKKKPIKNNNLSSDQCKLCDKKDTIPSQNDSIQAYPKSDAIISSTNIDAQENVHNNKVFMKTEDISSNTEQADQSFPQSNEMINLTMNLNQTNPNSNQLSKKFNVVSTNSNLNSSSNQLSDGVSIESNVCVVDESNTTKVINEVNDDKSNNNESDILVNLHESKELPDSIIDSFVLRQLQCPVFGIFNSNNAVQWTNSQLQSIPKSDENEDQSKKNTTKDMNSPPS